VAKNAVSKTFTRDTPTGAWTSKPEAPAAPVNSVAPVVSGSLTVGSTLSCTTGTWSGSPTYAYQWLRDSVEISGATSSTYELVEDDIDADISCEVTATNDGGSVAAESNAVGPVEEGGASTDLGSIWRYQDLGTGQTPGNAASDAWMAGGGIGRISTDFTDGGTTSLKMTIAEDADQFGYTLILPTNLVNGDTLWFSTRTYRPTGYSDAASPRLKFIRMHTETSAGANVGYVDWYLDNIGEFHYIYEGTQGNPAYAYPGTAWVPDPDGDTGNPGFQGHAPTTGVWETWDVCTVFGNVPKASGGTAESFFWKNKVLVGHVTTRETLASSTNRVDEIHHTTFWNGGAPQAQSLYVGRYAVAAKIAGVRDDTSFLATDESGNRVIALGY
jgi:hypothetical protein